LLDENPQSLTRIAYESQYYDQAHFIKDFKEFTGINPKDFYKDDELVLSSLIYAKG
jgi:AraC-like DNA-binding protein